MNDRILSVLFFLGSIGVTANIASGQPVPEQVKTEQAETRWAIAIHGGAGGDPSGWPDEKREGRRQGLEIALKAGRAVLEQGGSAMDAVEVTIRSLEDNARFNAGRGAVVTQEGNAELDASIMDGRTRACGAVAGVTRIKNPITAARKVMTDTQHVLLAGEGADEFADAKGLQLVPPDYFLSYHTRQLPPPPDEETHYGTVGCVVLDSHGNLAAGTSTGGTAKKLPGRIGDSPIVGAGTYADNQTCAVSGTGIGEEYIRNAVAYDVSAQMKYLGKPLSDAVTDVIGQRLQPGDGGLIAVSRTGQIVMQHNTPGMGCAAADSNGRFEVHLQLDNGGRQQDAPPAATPNAENEIRDLIEQQARDWNRGNLEGFMQAYWKSDELTFSSGGNITRGWQATFDRYRNRYPDAQAMGTVTFENLEFLRLDDRAMQVLGAWNLARDSGPSDTGTSGGRFTLVFQKQQGSWKIVHDHTSVDASR